MTEKNITAQIDSRGVAQVILNRPEKHNAFDDTMIAELIKTFEALADNNDVRVVVLESRGKNFSAGADLEWMKRMAEYDYEANLADARLLAAMLKALYQLPQPTIAKVQGAAFGGAVGLVSCCDMAVAEEGASFCLSEAKIGLIPATIGPYVVRAIGERASKRYFTTAERFTAATAHTLGLVSEVAVTGELDEGADRIIEALLNNGPQAVQQAKQLVNDVAEKDLSEELIEDTCTRIARIRVSKEGQEGLTAFLNKRPASWAEE
ncbi:MAG: methylglutaconyl-CoA hydratase [Halioglobus sp.]|jgi:methylglutaconyl-CoA hydratase